MVSTELIKVLQADISARWKNLEVDSYLREKSYLEQQLLLMDKIIELKEYEEVHGVKPVPVAKKPEFDPFKIVEDEPNDDISVIHNTVISSFHDNPLVQAVRDIVFTPNSTKAIPSKMKPTIEASEQTVTATTQTDAKEPYEAECIFERNLRGGYLPDLKLFVPESIVRTIDAKNGNTLKVTEIKGAFQANGQPKYHFEVANTNTAPMAQKRVQFNQCPVKETGGRFYVERSMELNSWIRVNENMFSPVLSQEDVYNFRIKEGDLVDIAFYENSPNNAICIWKHMQD